MCSLESNRFLNEAKNPTFSSTLLDKIYRSIDEEERKSGDMKFYKETTTVKKQSRSNVKCNRTVDEEEVSAATLHRARLLEKWMDRKANEKVGTQGKHQISQMHHDQDVLFFSSTSTSSDSSSGGLSSSDTESMYGMRSRVSCFAPHRPKPVRTNVCEKSEKTPTERKQSALFHEQKGVQMFDDYSHISNPRSIESNEEGLIKSKSRALKIYNNLKKVKQPISPGGKLTNFLNSLFTTGNSKKTKSTTNVGGNPDLNDAERKAKSGQASTCSSASSFSRSCLSKTSPSSREKLHNGVKRTVRFHPVSVIVDEDSRPCGHNCLYEEEDTSLAPMSVPTAWKIGVKKNEEEVKSRGVEEAAREFLKEYYISNTRSIESNEEGLIKSKSRAMKIYNNLKKVKQPISPGGKITNFLNSLFTTGNSKKTKSTTNVGGNQDLNDAERKAKSGQASTCSSASSFSRSCLSKTSPSSREKLHNGVKRTVRFYPVSVIVDEDSRPCGHKCLYEEEDTSLVPMSVPTAWKIGVKKNEEEVKSRGVEEAAREFLKEYHRNKKKSDLVLRDFPMSTNEDEDEDEDEDDVASCSSSDLFELDHLTVMANDRYCEELPVYETTHVRS